jgi:hypothetical protein
MYTINYFFRSTSSKKFFLIYAALLLSLLTSIDAQAKQSLLVVSHPISKTIYEGESTTFRVIAFGSTATTYTWYKDGTALSGNGRRLTISDASTANAGQYSCRITDGTSSYTCPTFNLTVNQIVRITQQPASEIVNAGATASMSVSATGTEPISYQWYDNGTAITGATTSALSLGGTTLADAGNYYCAVSNGGSSATSSTASLSVVAVAQTKSVSISWSAPTLRKDGSALALADIAGYNVYYATSSTGAMTKMASLSATDLNYVVTDLQQGTYYFATTTVDNNDEESAMSTTVSATIQL